MRKEWTNIDKSGWPRGTWDSEPDKVQWKDKATGLPCLAVRHPTLGHWCGYVGVTAGHPAHRKEYGDAVVDSVEVHGGLTFAAGCSHGTDPGKGICHVPAPGEPDDVWWFGFDCAHLGDMSPGMGRVSFDPSAFYKHLPFVERECTELAAQIAALAERPA